MEVSIWLLSAGLLRTSRNNELARGGVVWLALTDAGPYSGPGFCLLQMFCLFRTWQLAGAIIWPLIFPGSTQTALGIASLVYSPMEAMASLFWLSFNREDDRA
jgi:hypothetical protein